VKEVPLVDLILTYSPGDAIPAAQIANRLAASGLSVLHAVELPTTRRELTTFLEAMREGVAMVVLLSPHHARSSLVPLFVGTAMSWQTPIFVVVEAPGSVEVPSYLRRYPVVSPGKLPDLIAELEALAGPLPDRDQKAILEAYARVGLPVQQLLTDPAEAERLAVEVRPGSRKGMPAGRLLTALVRMRKRGELPRLHPVDTANGGGT